MLCSQARLLQRQILRRCLRPLPAIAVDLEHRRRPAVDPRQRFVQRLAARRIRQHQRRTRVAQHLRHPLLRIRRVHRHVCAARLHDPQHRFDRPHRALHADRHQRLRAHAPTAQPVRQTIRAGIERRVIQRLPAAGHRFGRRRRRRMRFHRRMHRLPRAEVARGRIPAFGQLTVFVVAQQRQTVHRLVGSRHHSAQHLLQITRVTLHRHRVEQRRRVLDHAFDTAGRRLRQTEGQIEFRYRMRHAHRTRMQIGESQIARFVVLPCEHGLEDRCVRQTARRVHHFHHLLERQLLVLLRRQHALLHLVDQRRDRRTLQIHAHRQRVHEESDQTLHLAAATVRHRRAHHHIRLPRQPRQHHRPRRHQRHVQRPAVLQAQRLQLRCQRRVQPHVQQRATVILLRRTLAVRRQLQQRRRALQGLPPVRAHAREPIAGQALALPRRIVRILHRQRWQLVRLAAHPRRIQRFQLPRQHAHRPAVRHDVVHRQQQHVTLRRQTDQTAAQQRAALQIERCSGLQRLQRIQLALLRRAVQSAQIVFQQCESGRWADPLVRHAIHRFETRAQALVADHQLVQCALQRRAVQGAGQLHAQCDVVGVA